MKSIVSVITPADSYNLTTVEAVMIAMGKTSLTAQEGQAIESLIASGSALIQNYCNRIFPQETVLETFWPDPDALSPRGGSSWSRQFWGEGWGGSNSEKLRLERYPISSITSVYEDDVLIDSTEYRIESHTGFVFRLDSSGYPWLWHFGKSILITYIGGYDPIPADLARAASLYCVDSASSDAKDSLIKSETVYGVASTTYFDNNMATGGSVQVGDLSPRVMGMLDLYRRFPVG